MSLDKIGVNSLLAVNNWIGIINSNMQGSSRTGFKTIRANLTDGLGANRIAGNLEIPPATITVGSTQVEWGQGSIVNSEFQTHFALNGEGFFVLYEPNADKYYVSRDGEFHWDHQGYLVNSGGLRVVSSGQDFIRYGENDETDMFQQDGYSRDLARFGDKSFLLVDFVNRDNLRMSKYGSTVYELDGDLTTRVQNDLTKTTDGLSFVYDDPIFQPVVDPPGFVTVINPPTVPNLDFSINFGANGVYTFAGFDPGVTTLDAVITDLQLYATAQGFVSPGVPALEINFDTNDDVLNIINRVTPGQENGVYFGGVNGTAMRKFFKIPLHGGGAIDELTTPLFDANYISSTEDIDNSYLVPYKDLNFPGAVGPPPRAAIPTNLPFLAYTSPIPSYTHNKVGGFVEAQTYSGASMIISESSQTDQFEIVMNVKTSDNGLMIFGFGQDNAHSFNSGGYDIVYNPTNVAITSTVTYDGNTMGFPVILAPGGVIVRQKPKDYGITSFDSTIVGAPGNVGSIGVDNALFGVTNTSRVAITLDANKNLSFSIGGNVAKFNLGGGGQNIGGSLTLRNQFDLSAATATGNFARNALQVHSIHVDMKRSANAITTGEMQSVGLLDISRVEQGVFKNGQRTFIKQAALESSTASLTEFIPMLGLAQKVFSAVSKIISTYNQTVDDLNGLIR